MNAIKKVRLGKSDLKISRVGTRTAAIGSTSSWRVYCHPEDEGSAIRAIQTAIGLG